jgi:hypothetical protein
MWSVANAMAGDLPHCNIIALNLSLVESTLQLWAAEGSPKASEGLVLYICCLLCCPGELHHIGHTSWIAIGCTS